MVKRISSLDTNYIIKKKSTNDQIGINFKKINDFPMVPGDLAGPGVGDSRRILRK